MCWPVRNTDRRGTPSLRMCERVVLARRKRAIFLSMFLSSKAEGFAVRSAGAACGNGLRLLGFLHVDLPTGVAHTLALVGLGLAVRTNLGRNLTHQLLVKIGRAHV